MKFGADRVSAQDEWPYLPGPGSPVSVYDLLELLNDGQFDALPAQLLMSLIHVFGSALRLPQP